MNIDDEIKSTHENLVTNNDNRNKINKKEVGYLNESSFDESLSGNSQFIISNNSNNNNIDNASDLLNLESIKNYRKDLNVLLL